MVTAVYIACWLINHRLPLPEPHRSLTLSLTLLALPGQNFCNVGIASPRLEILQIDHGCDFCHCWLITPATVSTHIDRPRLQPLLPDPACWHCLIVDHVCHCCWLLETTAPVLSIHWSRHCCLIEVTTSIAWSRLSLLLFDHDNPSLLLFDHCNKSRKDLPINISYRVSASRSSITGYPVDTDNNIAASRHDVTRFIEFLFEITAAGQTSSDCRRRSDIVRLPPQVRHRQIGNCRRVIVRRQWCVQYTKTRSETVKEI